MFLCRYCPDIDTFICLTLFGLHILIYEKVLQVLNVMAIVANLLFGNLLNKPHHNKHRN